MEEQHRGARVASSQLHKGTQTSCIGGEPLFYAPLCCPLLTLLLLHRFAQLKQQVPHFCEGQWRDPVNLEELEESAIRSVDPVARLCRRSEEGQVAPAGEQLS